MRVLPSAAIATTMMGVLLACGTGGCANADHPPTPTTASFDMQPVPKRPGSWRVRPIDHLIDVVTHRVSKQAALINDPYSADQRRKAIYELVQRDFAQQPPWTQRYQQIAQLDPDATVRAAAVRALNASRDKSAVPVFLAALTDKSDLVRLQAAKALSNIPDPTAAEPLARVLGNQAETRDVRIAASEALRHYRKMDVARVLAGTVNGRDFSIAWQSRWTLKILTGNDYGYDERAWLEYLAGPNKPLG
jgi:hypothetical protein